MGTKYANKELLLPWKSVGFSFVCLFHRRKLVKFPMEENNLYRPKAKKELRGQRMVSELKYKQEAKPGGYVDEAQLIPDRRS